MNLSNFQGLNEEEDNSPSYKNPSFYKSELELANLNNQANFSMQNQEETTFLKTFASTHDKFHSFVDWVERPREDPSISFYEKLKKFEILKDNKEKILDVGIEVNTLAISPNSQYLSIGSDSNPVQIWDLTQNCLIAELGHESVMCSALQMTNEYIFSGGWQKNIIKWDIASRAQREVFEGHKAQITCLFLDESNGILASSAEENHIFLWDTNNPHGKRKIEDAHSSVITSVVISKKLHLLISASWDMIIKIWNLKDLTLHSTLEEHTDRLVCLALSSYETMLAAGETGGEIKIWDFLNKKVLYSFKEHWHVISGLTFSANNRFIISGSFDSKINVWDLKKEEKKSGKEKEFHSNKITALITSENKNVLISGGFDKKVRIQKIGFLDRHHLLDHENKEEVLAICTIPYTQLLVSGGKDQILRIWDLLKNKIIRTIVDHNHSITALYANRFGLMFASGDQAGIINLWDSKTYDKLWSFSNQNQTINFLKFHPMDDLLFSFCQDKSLYIYNCYLKKVLESSKHAFGEVITFDMTSEGDSLIAFIKNDDNIGVWNSASLQKESFFAIEPKNLEICSLKLTKKNEKLIAGSTNGKLMVWSYFSKQLLKSFSIPFNIIALKYLPTESIIITSNEDNLIRFWELETENQVRIVDNFKKRIKIMDLTIDNSFLLIANAGSQSIEKLPLNQLKTKFIVNYHSKEVKSLAISSDGKMLAAGSEDLLISLWSCDKYQFIGTLEGHSKTVTSLIFSPDCKKLYSGSADSTLRVWDIETKKQLMITKELTGTLTSLVLYQNGERIIAASTDNSFTLIKTENLEQIVYYCHDYAIHSLVLSYNDNNIRCFSAGKEKVIYIHSLKEDDCQFIKKSEPKHECIINALAVTNNFLYSADEKGKIIIWDIKKDSLTFHEQINAHNASITCLIVNSKKTTLFSASLDKYISVWDLLRNKKLSTFEGHLKAVNQICLSNEDSSLCSAGSDQTVRVWNLKNVSKLPFYKGHCSYIIKITLSHDKNYLLSLSGSNSQYLLWDIKNNNQAILPETTVVYDGKCNDAFFLKDKRFIIMKSSSNNGLRLFNFDGTLIQVQDRGTYPTKICPTLDDNIVLVAYGDGKILFWNISTNEFEETILDEHFGDISALVLTRNGEKLYSGAYKTIIVWDFKEKKSITSLNSHENYVKVLKLNANESLLFSGGEDKKVIVWDLKTYSIIKKFDYNAIVRDIALTSNDEFFIVALSPDNPKRCLFVYNLKKMELLPLFENACPGIYSIVLLDDNTLITAGNEKKIKFFDLKTQKLINEIRGYSHEITGQAFSYEKNMIALATKNNDITLWDANTKKILGYLEGHKGAVHNLVFNSKNQLISRGEDRAIRVWDLNTFECLAIMQGHAGDIYDIRLINEETQLISTSSDCTIKVWDMITYAQIKKIKTEIEIYTLCPFPNSEKIVIVDEKNYVKLFDLEEDKNTKILAILNQEGYRVDFSPDGKILMVALQNSNIQLLETKTYTVISEIESEYKNWNYKFPIFFPNKSGSNRIAICFGGMVDVYNGETIFEFITEKEITFFYNPKTNNYLYLTDQMELLEYKKENFSNSLYHAINDDSLLNLKGNDNICDRKVSVFPYFLSFLHLSAIYENHENFNLEKVKEKYKDEKDLGLLSKLYYLDICFNTPLDILIKKKNATLIIKYLKMILEVLKSNETKFKEKIRFFMYSFRDNYSFMHLLCDVLPMLDQEFSVISELFDCSFIFFDPSIYKNDLFCPEIPGAILIETDTIFVDKNFLERKIKQLFNSSEDQAKESIETNQSILKAKVICLPYISDLSNPKTLEFFEIVADLDNDNAFFNNSVFSMIVLYIWSHRTKSLYFFEFGVFFIFFLLFNINYLVLKPLIDVNSDNDAETCSKIIACLLLIYGIFCFFNEARQFYNSETYFKSIWNYFDIALIPLLICSSLLDLFRDYLTNANITLYSQLCYAFCMFCFWFRFLSYSRGFRQMSSMIRLILQVISGVRYFVLFMVLFMLTLTTTFYLLQVESSGEISNFWETLLAFYQSSVGETDDIVALELIYTELNNFFMITATFLFNIISMNLLVSIIGDKHSENKENEQGTRIYELTNIIVDSEYSLACSFGKCFFRFSQAKYIVELYNEKHEIDDTKEDQIKQILDDIRIIKEKQEKGDSGEVEKIMEKLQKLSDDISDIKKSIEDQKEKSDISESK